jgi:hypothetical protein
MASAKTEFIYLDNMPAECERESRKERKEADARAINKTSEPQIFAVHAKKANGAYATSYLPCFAFVGRSANC